MLMESYAERCGVDAMISSSGNSYFGNAEVAGQRRAELRMSGCGDDQIDCPHFETRLLEAFVCDLRGGGSKLLICGSCCVDMQDVPAMIQTDCRAECLATIGKVRPMELAKPEVVVGPPAQHRCARG